MDANDFALKVAPAAASLGLVIRKVRQGKPPIDELGATSAAAASPAQLIEVPEVDSSSEEAAKEDGTPPLVARGGFPSGTLLARGRHSSRCLGRYWRDARRYTRAAASAAAGDRGRRKGHELVMRLGDRRYRVRGGRLENTT